MDDQLLYQLQSEGSLSEEEAEKIKMQEAGKPFSLHWELKTLLYVGVLLLNIGLGVLVYQNIDTFGHAILITVIGLVCTACFWYCWKHRQPFSMGMVESPTPYFDYVLMLGCFTFLIFEGYLQSQYQVFGTRYGLATFIPTVLFFATAYFFDHRGVLSLAITTFSAWLGVTVTPRDLLEKNDFDSPSLIKIAALLGAVLALAGLVFAQRNWKKHFTGTYLNFSIHFYAIAALSGLFHLNQPLVWIPVLLVGLAFFIWYAQRTKSFYFLLAALIYGYIGLTYCFFQYVMTDFNIYGAIFYFLISGTALVFFLINKRQTK